jgi:multisubunit Na+/H+ antiporter MnhB subunit
MGEITVLATAAIGVRALLRIAVPDRGGARPVHEPIVTSPIFRTAARYLMPLLLVFAVYLLARGHNEPGGGFVGGLVAAAAIALYLIAYGVQHARQVLWIKPMTLLAAGLSIALLSGLPAVARGQSFMTAQWTTEPIHIGTPVLFDVGVFLVVLGVVLMMIFSLAEES